MNGAEAGEQMDLASPSTDLSVNGQSPNGAGPIRLVEQPSSNDIFRSLFEHNPDGMYEMDLEGTIRAANPACERMAGYSLKELVGRSLRVLSPSHEHGKVLRHFRLAAEGEFQDFTTQVVHKDGHNIDSRILNIPVRVEGEVVGVYGILHDLTERTEAENAQRMSQGRFRAIFDGTAVGAALVDLSGRIIDVNSAFAGLAGHPRNDLVGARIVDITHVEDRAANWKLFQEMIDGVRAHYRLESRYVRKDERAVWVNLTTSIVRDADGAPQFCVAMAEDITDRKRLEEELRESQKMEAVGRLAGGIAHDFNNLLSVIQTYASFLSEDLDESDGRRDDANEIIKAGDRAATLVRQLLAFSRRPAVNPQIIQLNDVVVEMGMLLARTIGEDIQLRTQLDPDLWMTVIDPGGVENIIANLAVNSRDAMPAGGSLTIETVNVDVGDDFVRSHTGLHAGRYACLLVRDTGSGMTREVAARVFEPFFTGKPHDEGSGLGLSTVYGIVEQAGGRIFVYSDPGDGTSFEVYLPAAADEGEEREAGHARAEMMGRGRVVLLAEDEQRVRAVVRRMLERNGYTVIGGRPEEARDLAMRPGPKFDALLTDVVMPQLSGIDLARAVLKNHGDCPVVFMSGYSEEVLARSAGERPRFVAKPFTEKELIGALRAAIGAP